MLDQLRVAAGRRATRHRTRRLARSVSASATSTRCRSSTPCSGLILIIGIIYYFFFGFQSQVPDTCRPRPVRSIPPERPEPVQPGRAEASWPGLCRGRSKLQTTTRVRSPRNMSRANSTGRPSESKATRSTSRQAACPGRHRGAGRHALCRPDRLEASRQRAAVGRRNASPGARRASLRGALRACRRTAPPGSSTTPGRPAFCSRAAAGRPGRQAHPVRPRVHGPPRPTREALRPAAALRSPSGRVGAPARRIRRSWMRSRSTVGSAHERTAAAADGAANEPAALQIRQRLAQREPVDAEPGGELTLWRKTVARLKISRRRSPARSRPRSGRGAGLRQRETPPSQCGASMSSDWLPPP